MSDKYFLDTNIIVYSFDNKDPYRQQIARNLIEDGLDHGHTVISYQVVQEFINVATRKFAIPLTPDDCRKYINDVLHPLWEIYASRQLIDSALDIADRWQYSFYDALIVAAALEADCKILYTEDLQHRQKIHTLRIVNPFV